MGVQSIYDYRYLIHVGSLKFLSAKCNSLNAHGCYRKTTPLIKQGTASGVDVAISEIQPCKPSCCDFSFQSNLKMKTHKRTPVHQMLSFNYL